MGRIVTLDARKGGASPQDILFGSIEIQPTILRHEGRVTVLPSPSRFGISNGKATLEMAPSPAGPEPSWAYRVLIRDQQSDRAWAELIGVPDGADEIPYPDLPRFTTTVPPDTTAAVLQNWVATTKHNATRSEVAAGRAEAPTDEMNKNLLQNPGSMTRAGVHDVISSELETPGAPLPSALATARMNATRDATSRSFTVTTVPTGVAPGYSLIRLRHGVDSGPAVMHTQGGDSLSPISTSETMASYSKRLQPSVMINAGGWWETGRRMGLEIQDGHLIQDWETDPTFKLGVEAGVFMRDGSFRIYDRTTSGAQIVEDGGWNASSWGLALYRDGALTGIQDDPYWQGVTARQLIGDTESGDLVILSFPGKSDGSFGATAADVIDVAGTLNLRNLIFLDGGGSVQTYVNGIPVVPSSDAGGSRLVGDVYHFSAPMASPSSRDTGWAPITLKAGYTSSGATQTPLWCLGDKSLNLRGGINGTFGTDGPVVGSIGFAPGPGVEYVGAVSGPGVITGKIVITAVGEIRIFGPAGGGLTSARLDQCQWRLV